MLGLSHKQILGVALIAIAAVAIGNRIPFIAKYTA